MVRGLLLRIGPVGTGAGVPTLLQNRCGILTSGLLGPYGPMVGKLRTRIWSAVGHDGVSIYLVFRWMAMLLVCAALCAVVLVGNVA